MTCPRCGNQWDVSKTPCSRCGLLMRPPRPVGGAINTPTVSQFLPTYPREQPPSMKQATDGSLYAIPRKTISEVKESTSIYKSVPVRPKSRSLDGGQSEAGVSTTSPSLLPLRLNRLPAAPVESDKRGSSISYSNLPAVSLPGLAVKKGASMFQPGTVLRGGRYLLQTVISSQEWLYGASEVMWAAQDLSYNQRQGIEAQATICELMLPERGQVQAQALLSKAIAALKIVGLHGRIPSLWDVFQEQGRHFLVFEPVQGESLSVRLQRNRQLLSEQDAIDCCLQMTELLELFTQQSPPLVHGQMRPEHIRISADGRHYLLTNFSVVLAGGATSFTMGIGRFLLSPYAPPEFGHGVLDVRTDLYMFLAAIYHMVTGSLYIPGDVSVNTPTARQFNLALSEQFSQLLAQGLYPVAGQRYQTPLQLRRALLALRLGESQVQQFSPARQQLSAQTGYLQNIQPMPETAQVVEPSLSDLLTSSFTGLEQERERALQQSSLPKSSLLANQQHVFYWLMGAAAFLLIVGILSIILH